MSNRKPFNPFYVLLLLAGLAFAVTACAYGVMTVRELHSSRVAGYDFDAETSMDVSLPKDFNDVIDRYGANAMIIEILLLGFGTFGAIAYDQRLDKQEALATEKRNEGEMQT